MALSVNVYSPKVVQSSASTEASQVYQLVGDFVTRYLKIHDVDAETWDKISNEFYTIMSDKISNIQTLLL